MQHIVEMAQISSCRLVWWEWRFLWGSILLCGFRSHSKKLSLEAVSSVFPRILKFILHKAINRVPNPRDALNAEVLCNQVLENHLTVLVQTSDFVIHIHTIDTLGFWEDELLPISFSGESSLHKVLTTKQVASWFHKAQNFLLPLWFPHPRWKSFLSPF